MCDCGNNSKNTSSILKKSFLVSKNLKHDVFNTLYMLSEDYTQIKICEEFG